MCAHALWKCFYSFKYKDKMRGCRPRAGWRRTWSRDVVMAARLGHINANPPHFTPCAARCNCSARARTQRPQPERTAAAARAHSGRRRRREEEAQRVYGWRGGAASFRRADTAKVCNNVGLVVVDGASECSAAVAATQGVSGRLRARKGLRHLLAATSAFDATSKRHVSRWPQAAECIRGVCSLKKN